MEVIEIIGEEHLKVILKNLSCEDIVKFAYNEWIPSQKSGHTIINLENGLIKGLSIGLNEISIVNIPHIKLFSIDSFEEPINPGEMFTEKEYEEYLDFKDDDPCDYTPDIISDFCKLKEIDEDKRKIKVLAKKLEETELKNYSIWESKILNEYHLLSN